MRTTSNDRAGGAEHFTLFGVAKAIGIALAASSMACAAATPLKRPSEPLVSGEPTWPENVAREAERADRICSTRETQLFFDYKEAKEEEQKFKTIIGSITGAVGTAGGVVAGIGTYVIDDPSTKDAMTGITGFITAGLGAAGSVVTILVSPGAAKAESSSKQMKSIDEKRMAARKILKDKDPGSWSDAEKEAWSKASKDLEATCK